MCKKSIILILIQKYSKLWIFYEQQCHVLIYAIILHSISKYQRALLCVLLWFFWDKNWRVCMGYESPFNHIFSRPYDGLLCIVMSLNMIVLLLLFDDTDDDDILCVYLNCCVAFSLSSHPHMANKCIFLWCGNKHIFIGLTHQTMQ